MTTPLVRRSLSAQISAVEREIKMRGKTYPSLISRQKMSQGTAEEEIRLMENVLLTLQRIDKYKDIINAAIAAKEKTGNG